MPNTLRELFADYLTEMCKKCKCSKAECKCKKSMKEVYEPKPEDEVRFKEKHGYDSRTHRWPLFKNMYSEKEYDALFSPKHPKEIDRAGDRHGYNAGEDEKYYESYDPDGETLYENYGSDGVNFDVNQTLSKNVQEGVGDTSRKKLNMRHELTRTGDGMTRLQKALAAKEYADGQPKKVAGPGDDVTKIARRNAKNSKLSRRKVRGM